MGGLIESAIRRETAQQGPDEQAVGLERLADLDQGADQIVGPVQGQGRDDKVQAFGGEGQAFLIGLNAQATPQSQHSG